MVDDTDLQVFYVVGNVTDDGDGHHAQGELDVFELLLELLLRGALQDFLDFLLWGEDLGLAFAALLDLLELLADLLDQLLVGIVDYIDQKLPTFIHCGPMIEQYLEQVADHSLMIHRYIAPEGIELGCFVLEQL